MTERVGALALLVLQAMWWGNGWHFGDGDVVHFLAIPPGALLSLEGVGTLDVGIARDSRIG